MLLAAGLLLAGAVNSYGPYGIYPVVRKGMIEMPTSVSSQGYGVFTLVELEKWNALSRVSVSPEELVPPRVWAPSAKLPPSLLPQRELHIDGGASTTIRRFSSMADLEHLKYDVVNVPYYLRPEGGAAIVGLGGGKDPRVRSCSDTSAWSRSTSTRGSSVCSRTNSGSSPGWPITTVSHWSATTHAAT